MENPLNMLHVLEKNHKLLYSVQERKELTNLNATIMRLQS